MCVDTRHAKGGGACIGSLCLNSAILGATAIEPVDAGARSQGQASDVWATQSLCDIGVKCPGPEWEGRCLLGGSQSCKEACQAS